MVRRGATRSTRSKGKNTRSKKAKDVRVGVKKVRRRTVNAPKVW